MSALKYIDRQKQLRAWLKTQKLDGYLVPRSDAFLGEYVPASAERLHWLTAYTGSWGTAVISQRQTALIVDGRYTTQANQQTRGQGLQVLTPATRDLQNFLSKTVRKSARIGFDPWLFSIAEARKLSRVLSETGLELIAVDVNPIDLFWADRPVAPHQPVTAHPVKFAGMAAAEKLGLVAREIRLAKCKATLLTDPHSVAWVFNLRGSDIAHTPIALLRAMVKADGTAILFVDGHRLSSDAKQGLGKNVRLQPAEGFSSALSKLCKTKATKVLLSAENCPEAINSLLKSKAATTVESGDPCSLYRARKNTTEQRGARKAHLRDGAALSNFLCWLGQSSAEDKLTEKAAQDKLEHFRRDTGKLVDLSFGTISASGPNAALPHYHVAKGQGRTLRQNEIYLVDSGGQYRDGTTDVTRTVVIGTATSAMKTHNTLVLKGMIAVSMARFPAGTTGAQIDALARAALWQHGFDFDHGTGHGVGSFLSVHEGPARISKAGHVALEPGMIISNEPGYYAPGKYGIRIENLLLVKPASKPTGGNRKMLSFETLTFAPIDKQLLDERLLTEAELHWLNHYHATVMQKIGGLVSTETRSWLQHACAPLTRSA
jgi:Xaa-Pro aminopeptidase